MRRLQVLTVILSAFALGILVRPVTDAVASRVWRASPEAAFLRYRRDALLAAEARE